MSEKYLAGRVAVITGGSRGLGRAMALSFAKRGATIALVGRDRAKLDESQKLVAAEGVEVTTFTCDVRDEAQVKKLADDVKAKFGKVHILINNAGTAIRKNLVDFSFDEWKVVIDTNLHGVFLCTKYLLPLMKGHGYGRIINIGSIMGHVGSTGRSAYCATKAGVLSLDQDSGPGTGKGRYHRRRHQPRLLRDRPDRSSARRPGQERRAAGADTATALGPAAGNRRTGRPISVPRPPAS